MFDALSTQFLQSLDAREIYTQVLQHLPELETLSKDSFEVTISFTLFFLFIFIILFSRLFDPLLVVASVAIVKMCVDRWWVASSVICLFSCLIAETGSSSLAG